MNLTRDYIIVKGVVSYGQYRYRYGVMCEFSIMFEIATLSWNKTPAIEI